MANTLLDPFVESTIDITKHARNNQSQLDGFLLQLHPMEIRAGLLQLDHFPFTIGRDPSSDLQLTDASISRHHATIERADNQFFLTDLGSTNGTQVNHIPANKTPLRSGDEIRFANMVYKFLASNQFETEYYSAVYNMMTRDGLTGAWNKKYFHDQLTRELTRFNHHGGSLHLILFDLDHFKKVNDTYGHVVGDEVLSLIGLLIPQALPDDALFARYGGEEFAILLTEIDQSAAYDIARQCCEAVAAQPLTTKAGRIPVTISVGLASLSERSHIAAEEFIEKADTHLYAAKHAGRNQVRR